MRFDILWRGSAGDVVLATATHTFNPPPPSSYNAVAFETDASGIAAAAAPGDRLVLRFTTTSGGSYTPNGDGTLASARDPNLTLP